MSKIPFDDWLFDRLNDHDSPLDLNTEWEALAPMIGKKEEKRKRIFLWWILGTAAAMLVLWIVMGQRTSTRSPYSQAIQIPQSKQDIQPSSTFIHPSQTISSSSSKGKRISDETPKSKDTNSNLAEGISTNNNSMYYRNLRKSLDSKSHYKNHPFIRKQSTISYQKATNNSRQNKIILSPKMSRNSSLVNMDKIPIVSSLVPMQSKVEYRSNLDIQRITTKPDMQFSTVTQRSISYLTTAILLGGYTRSFKSNSEQAKRYIAQKDQTERLLEALGIEVTYHKALFQSDWHIGMGLGVQQDNFQLYQNFRDTIDKRFDHHPTEVKVSRDLTQSISKYDDVRGKAVYYVHRRINGYRRVLYIPFDITYSKAISLRHRIGFSVGGALGLKTSYFGQVVPNLEHNIWTVNYKQTIEQKLTSSYYFDIKYSYKFLQRATIFVGLRYQSEISGDEGTTFRWQENRKYLFLNAGAKVYL